MDKFRRIVRNQYGQAMAEYGPLIVFVALVALAGLTVFRDNVKALFDKIVIP